jgi:hypothetical protein
MGISQVIEIMGKFELNLAATLWHAGKEIGHAGSGTL